MEAVTFVRAEPVWAKELTGVLNAGVRLRGVFPLAAPGLPVTLRVAGMSWFRVWCNGRFVALGPGRTAHGYARVDEFDLSPFVRQGGENEVVIEVVAYHAWCYSHVMDPGFVQAEVVAGGQVLLATTPGEGGKASFEMKGSFEMTAWEERLLNARRYAFQRGFSEVYDVGKPGKKLTTVARSPRKLLPRRAPHATTDVALASHVLASGPLIKGEKATNKEGGETPFWWEPFGPERFKQYTREEWERNPLWELSAYKAEVTSAGPEPVAPRVVSDQRFALYGLMQSLSGSLWIKVRLKGNTPARVVVSFDEQLDAGLVNPRRMDCVNVVEWKLEASPGKEYVLESHEPYTAKYLQVQTLGGEVEVLGVGIRRFENPEASLAKFACSDEALTAIFDAGRATFAQNAVDYFMDCPSRERAGWLGDSFFTARAALALTGSTEVERAFLENFLLSPQDAKLPEGMIPMCYPADHPDGNFIPQWTLWLILQLSEYKNRGGSPDFVASFGPRIDKLLKWFERFEREDGLLTALPGWSFIEWSKANEFQKDLNYPTNMLYGTALKVAGELWHRPEWAEKGARVLQITGRECWAGEFFVDNADLKDGKYVSTTNRTEVCQYYAFYFGAATRQTHAGLWARLVDEFGPDRVAQGRWPDVWEANMIWGIMLRLELLRAAGGKLREKVLDDLRGYLLPMVRSTGTIWEHAKPSASCNHGFASHACHLLFEEALGVIIRGREVTLRQPPSTLSWCRGEIPVNCGVVRLAWRKDGPHILRDWEVPDGYTVRVE